MVPLGSSRDDLDDLGLVLRLKDLVMDLHGHLNRFHPPDRPRTRTTPPIRRSGGRGTAAGVHDK